MKNWGRYFPPHPGVCHVVGRRELEKPLAIVHYVPPLLYEIHNKPNPLFSSPQQIKAYPYNIATHWMKEYLRARAAL